ncbi:hypothetical protein BJY14_008465 [Actinomadura luteofluorescens]|uniref:Uncharacterized protein n=1 Tax=Actinomadura luteofluorescens TaxID=46163 RepID=A0A7Y9ER99_9ACTN|nr:hypothetical protein [Actinomadura luteofluorescens]NYD52482.1 hypothetical protein [Actinomadura luteofluorescens]
MLLGALSGIAAAICIVLVPHREGMVAVCPPEWAVAVSPGLLIGLLLSAAVMPRLTFAACLPAMFGAVAGAVGALFSEHPVYGLVWTLWAVLFFFGQRRAWFKAQAESA